MGRQGTYQDASSRTTCGQYRVDGRSRGCSLEVTGYGVRFAQAGTGTILRALITTDRKRLCRSCVECIVHSDSDRSVRMASPSLRVYEAFPVKNEDNLALELLSASRTG